MLKGRGGELECVELLLGFDARGDLLFCANGGVRRGNGDGSPFEDCDALDHGLWGILGVW